MGRNKEVSRDWPNINETVGELREGREQAPLAGITGTGQGQEAKKIPGGRKDLSILLESRGRAVCFNYAGRSDEDSFIHLVIQSYRVSSVLGLGAE